MKKRLHFFDKVLYYLNVILALLLLFSYLLPFISPRILPILSIFNFSIPVLITINAIFLLYWVLKLRRQFILPLLVLVIGFTHFSSIYVFADSTQTEGNFDVLSYNVRHSDFGDWTGKKNVEQQIIDFLTEENASVIVLQDFYERESFQLDTYPHKIIYHQTSNKKNGLAIYSQHKIINSHNIDFPNSANNAIYADIQVNTDTLRVFNLHLESLKIIPDVKRLQEEDKEKLFARVGASFRKQAEQVELVKKHLSESPYPVIITGDFNNTAFSYVYNQLTQTHHLEDAFKAKGAGFGKTFDFDFIPIRIDFILADKALEVVGFTNYHHIELSDHYPIKAAFKL
ncbi:MAG: endonuclease/exonuclease/phosphatase family protein [Bacteroidota bacterium]